MKFTFVGEVIVDDDCNLTVDELKTILHNCVILDADMDESTHLQCLSCDWDTLKSVLE